MLRSTFRKHHKWFGIVMGFFLIVFCVSGILLNHRHAISGIDVSRGMLPSRYEIKQWNSGLLRGTCRMDDGRVAVYGSAGVFLTDTVASSFVSMNEGLPQGADMRQMRGMAGVSYGAGQKSSHEFFAVSQYGLYRTDGRHRWHHVALPTGEEERLTDVTSRGDTLVVLSRSYAYVATAPYKTFRRVEIPAPSGYDGKVSLFRTVWLLHSGELFGTVGVIIVDVISVILIIICVTGLAFWLTAKISVRQSLKRLKGRALKTLLSWHDIIGRKTIFLTLLICVTGWMLRPPMMIPLALSRVPAVPGTIQHSCNAWNDRLRMVRYDEAAGDWMVSTSEGFFSLGKDIQHPVPQQISEAPPVSVMGLNVWQREKEGGKWLCGSFSGMFVWDRQTSTSTDYFTHQPAPKSAGAPFGKTAVSGFTDDIIVGGRHDGIVVEYDKGTSLLPQPSWMNRLPMSLWNVALEAHSGRLFIGNIATYVFVLVMGMAAVWSLITGLKIGRKPKKNSKRK